MLCVADQASFVRTAQDSCSFYNDCALLKDFGGVVITTGEGNAVAGALEKKKAVILANHGILYVDLRLRAHSQRSLTNCLSPCRTVGTTIDAAVGTPLSFAFLNCYSNES